MMAAAANVLRPRLELRKYKTAPVGSPSELFLDDVTYGILDTNILASAQYATETGIDDIVSMRISRGRGDMTNPIVAGTAALRINNVTRQEDPTDYAIGQYAQIVARETDTSETPVFTGHLVTIQRTVDTETATDWLDISLAEDIRRLTDTTNAVPLAVADGYTVQQRITQALAQVPEITDIHVDAATMTLAGTTWAGTLLSVIQSAVDTEAGVFFQEKDGTMHYRMYSELYKASNYTGTFDVSSAGGATYPAAQFNTRYSPDRVFNHVALEAADGTVVADEDGASVTKLGRRVRHTVTEALVPANLTARATKLAATYADRESELDPVTVSATRGSWETKIPDLELYTTALRTVQGADINTALIEGLRHQWDTVRGWVTTMALNRAIPANAT
jgi:hypothetical protein